MFWGALGEDQHLVLWGWCVGEGGGKHSSAQDTWVPWKREFGCMHLNLFGTFHFLWCSRHPVLCLFSRFLDSCLCWNLECSLGIQILSSTRDNISSKPIGKCQQQAVELGTRCCILVFCASCWHFKFRIYRLDDPHSTLFSCTQMLNAFFLLTRMKRNF